MSNQHTKLGPARAEEPALTKLNDQHNTHAMPVRVLTMWLPRSLTGRGVHREPRAVPTVAAPATPLTSPRKLLCTSLACAASLNYAASLTCAVRLTHAASPTSAASLPSQTGSAARNTMIAPCVSRRPFLPHLNY